MESNVNGIRSGGIYGVSPTDGRKQRRQESQKPFQVHDEPEESKPPAEDASRPDPLTIAEREDNESGGKLDLTA